MIIRFAKAFTLVLALFFVGNAFTGFDQCRAVLNWVYRELTLNHLELSYERAMNKMLLSLHTVHQKTKDDPSYKKKVAKILNTLGKIDPVIQAKIQGNISLVKPFWHINKRPSYLKRKNLKSVFYEWRKLQKSSPHLFKDLGEYKIDDWDILTVEVLSKISQFKFTDQVLKNSLKDLSDKLTSESQNILDGKDFNEESLKEKINKTQNDLLATLNENFHETLYDFRSACSKDELKFFLNQEGAFCPLPKEENNFSELNSKLLELQNTLNESDLLNLNEPHFNLVENANIPIHLLNYQVSDHPKVSYCVRDPKLVDMIVIHHTQTKKIATPHDINKMHLNKSTDNDPWYMIGYNYLISDNFQGATPENPKVFQGRPPEIQGAHAGGRKIKVPDEKKIFYKNKTITCGGVEKNILDMAKETDNRFKDDGMKGNFNTYGIAVIGSYVPVKLEEVAGVLTPQSLLPDAEEFPSPKIIKTIAKLSCDLQRQNARIKKIVPHSYFKKTDCPGHWVDALTQIKQEAIKLGCQFDIELERKDKRW